MVNCFSVQQSIYYINILHNLYKVNHKNLTFRKKNITKLFLVEEIATSLVPFQLSAYQKKIK